MDHRPGKLTHDRAIFLYALLGGTPAVAIAIGWAWTGEHAPETRAAVTLAVLSCWLGCAAAARQRVVRPLQTMSNLLLALREGDFSFRARGAGRPDPLSETLAEINRLGEILQVQRRGTIEATALLSAVMKEIDVAIFAFDAEGRLRLVNPAGQELLGQPAELILGRPANAIGLGACLEGESNRILSPSALPRAEGRWGLRRTPFRENGRPHQLVVLGDLSRPLREEELKAWQKLVRVLGHELNNSLAPIKSIASTLGSVLEREPRAADWEEDLRSGLGVIAARSAGLERFLQAYSRLARLPPPQKAGCDLAGLLRRARALESRIRVEWREGPPALVLADEAQVEQAAINLLRNAVDAALEQRAAGHPKAGARLSWRVAEESAEISIEDDGPGVAETANLFVPFFTTKPEGSGIGLVLCRQIAENHGGALELRNRLDGPGCVAMLRLPLAPTAPGVSDAPGIPEVPRVPEAPGVPFSGPRFPGTGGEAGNSVSLF